jgi:hypothetical protein
MDKTQKTWITYALLAPAMLSATLLFSLAGIHIDTLLKAAIYGTSVCGFFYLYLGATTLALKGPKSRSSEGISPRI